jgi:hypothetical protein
MSDTTGASTPRRLRRINKSKLHVVNVDEPEISPGIGITVQPPVCLLYNDLAPATY